MRRSRIVIVQTESKAIGPSALPLQGWIFACASACLAYFLEGLEGEEPPYNLILIERACASHDDSTFKNIGCGVGPRSSEALKRHTNLSREISISDQRPSLSGEPSD